MPQGAKEYPDVTFNEGMIDTVSMKLVMAPHQYDVVVTTNQFGRYSQRYRRRSGRRLGLAPGLCVGERQAMAQCTHGSAPDIRGPEHRQSLRDDHCSARCCCRVAPAARTTRRQRRQQ